jgi:oxygen-independent coproporphyrinogen-3 oxidase|tara:strand:+ start:122 stop:1279 length:1158 start_codon:yes stop_codon:yes gene_type:complete
LIEDWKNGGFGIYIHWPFCAAKCPYCDFNSHVRNNIDQNQWLKAYLKEIRRVSEKTGNRVLNSIFFGGGTPSLIEPFVIDNILNEIQKYWKTNKNLEVTLEANPNSVDAQNFKAYRTVGINRTSMGIQSLNEKDLKALGRTHSVREALSALEIAKQNFKAVSFDLIYARQNQKLKQWESELSLALDLGANHMSLYQLTIEQGTAFGDRYNRGLLKGLPSDDISAELYDLTSNLCEERGFTAYEVSNYAQKGFKSVHNLIYWRYGDYIGIGPGAHGRLTIDKKKYATETFLSPEEWLNKVEHQGSGESYLAELSNEQQAAEMVMMGLRLTEGIDCKRFRALSGSSFSDEKIAFLKSIKLLEQKKSYLNATFSGRKVLNSVLAELLN